jgi:hypothetical protein
LDFPKVTPALWKALARRNEPERLFLQGTSPVRLSQSAPTPTQQASFSLETLTPYSLRYEVLRVAYFYRWDGRNRVTVTPPFDLMKDMLSVPVPGIPVPPVTRIVQAPIVAPSGEIVTQPGYHKATGVIYQPDSTTTIPPVAPNPTPQDVKRALEKILEPLHDFPFVSPVDRATAIAAMILPFVRELINGPTPLHLFTKPTAGTGATLLVDVLFTPSLGSNDIEKLSQQGDESEWQRTLTAILRKAPTVVLLDNVRELKSPQLAKAITDTAWQGRILGETAMADLPVRNVWAATGNNPTQHLELTRRIVRCRLDSGLAQPWQGRTFRIPLLRPWLTANRGELIGAILTIVRAWFQAGAPKGQRSLGMFESWAETLGGILNFAGVVGFLEHPKESTDDIENDVLRWLVTQWWEKHKYSNVETAVLRKWAIASDSPVHELLENANTERAAQTKFGHLIRSLNDRVFSFTLDGKTHTVQVKRGPDNSDTHAARYRLVKRSNKPEKDYQY